jgi:two-component system C4-dicarboxylate transport response regulator DctD
MKLLISETERPTQEVELLGNRSPMGPLRASSEDDAGAKSLYASPTSASQQAIPTLTNIVFLAEDDDVMRDAVAATLRCAGYLVKEACDGAELLDLLVDAVDDPLRRPCVVVADVRMPNLSGLGVLAALRRAMWTIPVLLITALRDPSVQTVALRLGAIGVLRKPFEAEILLTAVLNAAPGLGKEKADGV